MSSRIRYVKKDDKVLKSYRNFTGRETAQTEGASYSVEINLETMTYEIRNLTKRTVMNGGEGINNLHVLKRKVKDKLESLGVDFSTEIRDNKSREPGKNCAYKKEKQLNG